MLIKNHTFNVVDIFSGAGGMSTGFSNANFNVLYAIDKSRDAIKTYKVNHPNTKVIACDVREVDFTQFYDIDVIIGGFPCKPYSNANRKAKDHKDGGLFKEFLRAIKQQNPKIFVIENVPQIQSNIGLGSDKPVLDCIIDFTSELGYTVTYKAINMAFWGLPQKRERIFIIGSRIGEIEINWFDAQNHLDLVSVDDAISDLKVIKPIIKGDISSVLDYSAEPLSQYQESRRKNSNNIMNHFITNHTDEVLARFKYIKQGENWKSIPIGLLPSNIDKKQSNIYRRLESNNQSVTIAHIRKTLLLHPDFDRTLSAREAARIQGFDDNFIFYGTKDSVYQQIADAVPPLIAESLAKSIIYSIR